MAKVHRFVSNDFTVRAAAVIATDVVQEMQNIQKSLPLATMGVGRAMVGALLMASHLKEGQEVGVLFKGNGPLGSIYAEASFEGQVRGYCPNPHYIAPNPEDILSLGKALGFGNMTVSRHQPFQRQPFQGMVSMVSGEIGDDIAHYLLQSQQIRSVVSLGVYFDTQGKAISAGGVLVEVMPGVEDAVVAKIENNVKSQKIHVSKMIVDGAGPADILTPFMKGIAFTEIPHEHTIQYFCPCTNDRVKRALGILGQKDIEEMINENQMIKVGCQVCGRSYDVTIEELKALKEELHKNSLH